jgi:hypothetical protein
VLLLLVLLLLLLLTGSVPHLIWLSSLLVALASAF